MPKTTSHPPGSFCWIELGTTDASSARSFYTSLFGWTVNEFPMGPSGIYSIFQKNGGDVAAMYEMGGEMQGMPPFWMSYISVADADAACEKARGLGGNIHKDAFDVMDKGRMAVIADPQGAAFAVWQPKASIGVDIRDEAGSLCWNELQVRDLDKAKKFYAPLFNWRLKESPEYTEMHLGDNAVGGMIESKAPPEVPSFWMPYLAVDDCDAVVSRAQSLGGMVYAPAFDVPNVGRMAVLADPQGASFAIIKLELGGHQ